MERVKGRIALFFDFEKNRTTFTKEIRGGFVTFLTMSYILLVNPMVVTDWMGGDDATLFPQQRTELVNNVATATTLSCSLGTLLMGMVTNLPFAIGPGMSMNSVFAGTIPIATNVTQLASSQRKWETAVTSSLFGGLLVFFLGAAGLGPRILKWLPDVLKSAIRVGIGLFQCFLALRVLHIIQSEPTELLKFVDHFDFSNRGEDGPVAQILFGVTLFLTSSLYVIGVHSPILISIVLITIVCWIGGVGGVAFPSVPIQAPTLAQTWWNYAFGTYFDDASAIGVSISFAVITLFDVGGAMFAILAVIRESNELEERDAEHHNVGGRQAAESVQQDDDMAESNEIDGLVGRGGGASTVGNDVAHNARRVYSVVGITTIFSSMVGCSPTVVFLECLAGAASGSRTGFSSVVTSFLFLLSLPFGPVVRNVPGCAAVPALVLIGCFMMSSVGEIPWNSLKRAFPAFVTIMMMPFTASITPGIVGGVISYAALEGVDKLGVWWRQRRTSALVERPASDRRRRKANHENDSDLVA
jgi:adenine/guanine/hypoxanthine permease